MVAKVASGGSKGGDTCYWVGLPCFPNGVGVAYQFGRWVGEVAQELCKVGCKGVRFLAHLDLVLHLGVVFLHSFFEGLLCRSNVVFVCDFAFGVVYDAFVAACVFVVTSSLGLVSAVAFQVGEVS